MQTIQISQRLSRVSTFLSKGTYFADIGSDHAYLACYVCLRDHHAKAIAGELNKGPYLAAIKTVDKYNLQHRVDVRLGNGLEVLEKNEVSEIVIAGMGGSLIKSILELGKEKISNVDRIIVQPNIGEINCRKWFVNNGFNIKDETILEENNKIYEIIVADRVKSNEVNVLNEQELYFGPYLLNRKSPIFLKKWELRKIKVQEILNQVMNSKDVDVNKVNQFKIELAWIKEVLQNEKGN